MIVIFPEHNNIDKFHMYFKKYYYVLYNFFINKNAQIYTINNIPLEIDSNETVIICDIFLYPSYSECNNLHTFLYNYKNNIDNKYNFKLFCICGDMWGHPELPGWKFLNEVLYNLLSATNYSLINVSPNAINISKLWDNSLDQYLYNYKYFQFNFYYDGIEIEFNNNPINKILLSGEIHNIHYPERVKLLQLNNENVLLKPNDRNISSNYVSALNNYICCFASNVYKYTPNINAKIILLKYLEILSSGSLLLCDDSTTEELASIGIIHNHNCYITNMNNITDAINYIVNPDNREEIDRIRFNGNNWYKKYKEEQYQKLETLFD